MSTEIPSIPPTPPSNPGERPTQPAQGAGDLYESNPDGADFMFPEHVLIEEERAAGTADPASSREAAAHRTGIPVLSLEEAATLTPVTSTEGVDDATLYLIFSKAEMDSAFARALKIFNEEGKANGGNLNFIERKVLLNATFIILQLEASGIPISDKDIYQKHIRAEILKVEDPIRTQRIGAQRRRHNILYLDPLSKVFTQEFIKEEYEKGCRGMISDKSLDLNSVPLKDIAELFSSIWNSTHFKFK